MKKAVISGILVAILAIGLASLSSAATKNVKIIEKIEGSRAGGKKWALLVGVERYDDPGITPLRFSVADIRAVEETLKSGGAGIFDSIKLLSTDAALQDALPTRNNILASVKTMTELATENDTIVLYVSGHGITEGGKNYLVPMDAQLSLLADTAVPLERIYDYFGGSSAKAQLIILDACHSGVNRKKGDRVGMEEEFIFSADGRMTISSSDISEPSYEWEERGRGVFTYFLVEGLKGKADMNSDEYVTAKETEIYVNGKVRDWAFQHNRKQNPRMDSNISGDIVLTRVALPAPESASPDTRTPLPDTRAPLPEVDRADTGGIFLAVTDEWGGDVAGYTVETGGARLNAVPGKPVSGLPAGSRTLTIRARGYYDKETDVFIDAGRVRTHSVALRRLRGKAAVSSVPDGAEVYINGEKKGKTNDVFFDLIDGRSYKIKVGKDGYATSEEKTVTAEGERTIALNFDLLSLPALEIAANVEDFKLFIDGHDKGRAGGQTARATVDEPKTVGVKIVKEGYKDWERSGIALAAGRTERVTATLQRRNLLLVKSNADGAEVFVSENSKGKISKGELKIWDLPEGSYPVKLKLGSTEKRADAYVSDGMTAEVDFKLVKDELRVQRPESRSSSCPSDMAYIPPGSFTMGCGPGDTECDSDEKPAKSVSITKGFCMDVTEVANESYGRCGSAGQCDFQWSGQCYIWSRSERVEKSADSIGSAFKQSDHPVVCVDWNEANKYCSWAGKRLPSEAEWEYAARGGTTTKYYWGNSMDSAYAWYVDNSNNQTHPVGKKKANGFGLYDMAGNVWEWVEDCYDSGRYSEMPVSNPLNTSTGCGNRVLRGGSWDNLASPLRVSGRRWRNPDISDNHGGFRCAQD